MLFRLSMAAALIAATMFQDATGQAHETLELGGDHQ